MSRRSQPSVRPPSSFLSPTLASSSSSSPRPSSTSSSSPKPSSSSSSSSRSSSSSSSSSSPSNDKKKKLLMEIIPLEKDFPADFQQRRSFDKGLEARQKLLSAYLQLIILDFDYAVEKGIEGKIWKNLFHAFIEEFRKRLKETNGERGSPQEIEAEFFQFLDSAAEFYTAFTAKLLEIHNVQDNVILQLRSQDKSINLHRMANVMKSWLSALINLGDIERYREQQKPSSEQNWSKVREYYTRAMFMSPNNGRSYNQMAVVSISENRDFETFYFYFRSLSVKAPFLNARQNLNALFEKNKRSLEKLEDNIKSAKKSNQQSHKADLVLLFHRRFILAHGAIFTKIGLDGFQKIEKALIKDFEFHLKRGMLSQSINYKLACANLSAIHQSLEKEGQERAVLVEYSLILTFSMLQSAFAVLTKDLHLRDLFGLPLSFTEDLPELMEKGGSKESWMWLPFIRIILEWLAHNISHWRHVFTESSLQVPDGVAKEVQNYFWKDCATFFNLLQLRSHTFADSVPQGHFWEDFFLEGFAPLAELSKGRGFSLTDLDVLLSKSNNDDKSTIATENPCRLKTIFSLASKIASENLGFITYSENKEVGQRFSSALLLQRSGEAEAERPAESLDPDLLDLSDTEGAEMPSRQIDELLEGMSVVEDEPGIRELKEKQQQLLSLIGQEAQNTKELFAKVETRPIDLQPHFTVIIPDTNCLISGLNLVKAVLQTTLFSVVIPVTVLNELSGLQKGPEGVREQAEAAFKFLEGEFAKKNILVRAQTRMGNYLHNISLRTEMDSVAQGVPGKQTNDDVILECCVMQLRRPIQTRPSETASPAVLLTDDRNLKVKALARGVPVADCFDFEKGLERLVQKLVSQ